MSSTHAQCFLALIATLALALPSAAAAETVWRSTPPVASPLEPSKEFAALGFSGRHANYTNADTCYNKPLGRYLMCVTDGFNTQIRYDTRKDGPHQGKTVFQIIKEEIAKNRKSLE